MKTAEEYSIILDSVLRLQIRFLMEELQKTDTFSEAERVEGKIEGVHIALQKIKQSKFLTE